MSILADRVQGLAEQWLREVAEYVIVPLSHRPRTDPTAALIERQRIQDAYLAHRTVLISDIVAVLNQMTATERGLLAQRRAQADQALWFMRGADAVFALLCLLFGIYVLRMTYLTVIRPIRQTTDLMNRLARRDHSVVISRLGRRDEIGEIARALQVFKQMMLDTDDQSWVK